MKRSLRAGFASVLAAALAITAPANGAEPWESEYAKLLANHVTPGGVRYADWKKNAGDRAALKAVCDQIARSGPAGEDRNTRLAYYINAYNVWILQGVLDAYPIKSVRDIAPAFGFFSQPRIVVAGEKMSFNDLEKKIIIAEFADPRIHFAINCASTSCPPLLAVPFSAGTLDDQLTAATRAFLDGSALAVLPDGAGRFALSRIFDWYADDFKAAGGPVAFINRYRTKKIPSDVRISFQEYDWGLNGIE